MKAILTVLTGLALALPAGAGPLAQIDALDTGGAQIVLLGEVHDNPRHHENQAAAVAALAPSALVFEMFTPEQAETVNAMRDADADTLAAALDWVNSAWPDFAMYHPILSAAPSAQVFGAAVPRADLMAAMSEGVAEVFGDEAERFGLGPLPEEQQAAREALQMAAHCDALPAEMLPGMVAAQRLRDARFSATTLEALDQTGGPVVVITGNGHARADWGMPVYLAAAAPEARLFSLAQFEDVPDTADGAVPHDAWIVTEPAERDDPCAVFQKK
jgi:uncharacterized iron-regulated protein